MRTHRLVQEPWCKRDLQNWLVSWKLFIKDLNYLSLEADKEVKKLQSKINKQKIEQQKLQRELALKYGTQDDIL